ncbi:MAG: GIY-YIG nuclease family protein [Dehalococcoidia bacterium]|nr:GIY-YIG nuclease family protein [Dehalococcoidia bacterium]
MQHQVAPNSSWCVYVLRSTKNGRLYTGSTNDLQRRLEEHNRGKSRYTRSAGPFELVYSEECDNRLAARRRELFLKSGRGREFLKGTLSQPMG